VTPLGNLPCFPPLICILSCSCSNTFIVPALRLDEPRNTLSTSSEIFFKAKCSRHCRDVAGQESQEKNCRSGKSGKTPAKSVNFSILTYIYIENCPFGSRRRIDEKRHWYSQTFSGSPAISHFQISG